MWDNNMHLMNSAGNKAGQVIVLHCWFTITSAHHDDPLNEAEEQPSSPNSKAGAAHQFSYKAWRLWKSDIIIEGDPQVSRHPSMLYHLYSFTREGTALSPSPMD